MRYASPKVRRARQQLQRELYEPHDPGAPQAIAQAVDELIKAHITPLIEASLRGELREAKRKGPKRAGMR